MCRVCVFSFCVLCIARTPCVEGNRRTDPSKLKTLFLDLFLNRPNPSHAQSVFSVCDNDTRKIRTAWIEKERERERKMHAATTIIACCCPHDGGADGCKCKLWCDDTCIYVERIGGQHRYDGLQRRTGDVAHRNPALFYFVGL